MGEGDVKEGSFRRGVSVAMRREHKMLDDEVKHTELGYSSSTNKAKQS